MLCNLQHITERYAEDGGAIVFPPALLWEILDPEHYSSEGGAEEENGSRSSQTQRAQMRVTTSLTHPLVESPIGQMPAYSDLSFDDQLSFGAEELGQVFIDDLLGQFGGRLT